MLQSHSKHYTEPVEFATGKAKRTKTNAGSKKIWCEFNNFCSFFCRTIDVDVVDVDDDAEVLQLCCLWPFQTGGQCYKELFWRKNQQSRFPPLLELQILATNYLKKWPNTCWAIVFFRKQLLPHFWANFGESWATFYSNIWSQGSDHNPRFFNLNCQVWTSEKKSWQQTFWLFWLFTPKTLTHSKTSFKIYFLFFVISSIFLFPSIHLLLSSWKQIRNDRIRTSVIWNWKRPPCQLCHKHNTHDWQCHLLLLRYTLVFTHFCTKYTFSFYTFLHKIYI